MYAPMPEASPMTQATLSERYQTGVGEAFLMGGADALNTISPGLLGSALDYYAASNRGSVLTEDEWKQSPWFREGLAFNSGMTADLAELLSQRHDRNAVKAFEYDKATTSGRAAYLAGEFIGSIPDPMNFLPIARMTGIATKSAEIFGKSAGHVIATAADAAIGVGLYQPAVALDASLYQEPWDFSMALANVAIGVGIGTGLGFLSRPRLSQADHLAATSKATADVIAGRPVDVSPIIGDQGQVLIPGTVRTPEQIKALDADYKRTVAQAAELDRQIAQADPALAETLRGTRDALMRQANEQAVELGSTVKADMTIPPRVVSELPAVEPTTAANVYQPVAADEVDFSVTDRRYKELETQGLLDADTTRAMDAVAVEKETISAWSKAWEIAGTCLMGK